MKIYASLTLIFAFVTLLGLIPISQGFYRPTHKFLKNTLEAVLEKQLETRFGKSGYPAPWQRCYWRRKTICKGPTHKFLKDTLEAVLEKQLETRIGKSPKTYPVRLLIH